MGNAVEFELNGKPVSVVTDPTRFLLWALRTEFGLTGTKYGCGVGLCGACTVLADNEPVRACQTFLSDVAGKKVTTIEGLADGDTLHPLQQAFVDHSALQCGFCTPGMIMSAYGLLLAKPAPTEADVLAFMDGNLCRCGTYSRIVQAILAAAEAMKGMPA